MYRRSLILICIAGLYGSSATAEPRPLKVFILAGQSNMQGHADVRTLAHIGMDPRTAPILRALRRADGTPRVCRDVWISYRSSGGVRAGRLTTGFGASVRKIGPELSFGIYMRKALGEPILIIKTAWGGKSLHTDFRPPGAGPYRLGREQLARLAKQKRDIATIRASKARATGQYYRRMISHVKAVLGDIGSVCPGHDPRQGHQLAGFVWFQGWNDMVDGGSYPRRHQPGGYDRYATLLAQLIRDVRKDLRAPGLPFVIGVMGVGGPTAAYLPGALRYKAVHQRFRDAMAAPAALPEFKGNVTAVLTERYWDPELKALSEKWDRVKARKRSLQRDGSLSRAERRQALEAFTAETFTAGQLETLRAGTSNAAYHYLGSAKIMARIGKGFAEALARSGRGSQR